MTETNEAIATGSGTFRIGGDIQVHRLGFGAMRITGDGVWGPPADHDECIRVLRRAIELGIDFIDTADSYGPEVSERLIAEALHPYPNGLVIATKAGLERPGPGKWEPNGRPEHLRSACEESLKRLRLDRIDLYQLHRIDPKVPAEDQFETLVRLRAEGKIRHIGLSEVGVDEIRQASEYFPVATVQNQYNLGDRRWEEVLEFCEQQNIGFIPWFPLATGKLATDGKLDSIAKKHDAAPSQIALAWLLSRSPVVLPIPGTSKVKHLEENTAAAGIRLDEDDMNALMKMGG
ncbi:MAG: aldo/keto reductase [Thermoanaerobaculia bacterium]